MTRVFMNEIEQLKKRLLALSALVEEQVLLAVQALGEGDESLALDVAQNDHRIDAAEVEVEEEALKILALHQPVATDLRFLTAVLKINNDLERIGDLAVNIAKRARKMSRFPADPMPEAMRKLSACVRDMVRDSLNALVQLDAGLAAAVCRNDQEADRLCREIFSYVEERARAVPDHVRYYLHMLMASRNLERIGDHATNIAEDVLYLIKGEIVRHEASQQKAPVAEETSL